MRRLRAAADDSHTLAAKLQPESQKPLWRLSVSAGGRASETSREADQSSHVAEGAESAERSENFSQKGRNDRVPATRSTWFGAKLDALVAAT